MKFKKFKETLKPETEITIQVFVYDNNNGTDSTLFELFSGQLKDLETTKYDEYTLDVDYTIYGYGAFKSSRDWRVVLNNSYPAIVYECKNQSCMWVHRFLRKALNDEIINHNLRDWTCPECKTRASINDLLDSLFI